MACLRVRGTHQQLNRMADVSPSAKPFTPKQGQYLAFIHLYTRLHRKPPAETDCRNISASARLRFTRWCSRSKEPVSSEGSQGRLAASRSSLIRILPELI